MSEPSDADAVDPGERKERVLHTRVPESLDRHIKRRARSLGMSVSTVVRNVLLHTFGLVGDIVTDSTNVALAIAGEEAIPPGEHGRGRAAGGDRSDIIGWQDVVLSRNAVCEHCNAILRRGARAAIGVRDQPGPAAIICRRCLGTLAGRGGTPGRRRQR